MNIIRKQTICQKTLISVLNMATVVGIQAPTIEVHVENKLDIPFQILVNKPIENKYSFFVRSKIK